MFSDLKTSNLPLYNQFSKKLYNMDQTGVDSTEDLCKIIVSATESVIPRKHHMRKKTKYNRKWFDKSCSQLRSELNRLSVQCSRKPMNPLVRRTFIQCRREYKKLPNQKEKEYLNKLKEQLKNLEQKNPKQFWAIIKNLQSDNTLKIKNPIDYDKWLNYFRKLYAVDSADQDTEILDDVPTNSESFQNHETDAISLIINKLVASSEVIKVIKKLENGKAAGEDTIINEVLKTGEFCLVDPIIKLLNLIIQSEKYPRPQNG